MLADGCGRVMNALIDKGEAGIMARELLHADDTPIRVLDKSMRGLLIVIEPAIASQGGWARPKCRCKASARMP
jgi:hypothetical protein